MQTDLSDRELALYLRDGIGSAELVGWATRIAPSDVHRIAQGSLEPNHVDSKALRLAFACCMWAQLAEGEQIADWLATPAEASDATPVSLIWAGDAVGLSLLLA